jgi:Domain of unknown function (DUF5916)
MRAVRVRNVSLVFAFASAAACAFMPAVASAAQATFTIPYRTGAGSADAVQAPERWTAAATVDSLTDLATRAPVGDGTVVRAYYDDVALHVQFECVQHEPITASQLANDVGFGVDDFVGVTIDTSGNGSRVYLFELTPRGTRYQQATESTRYHPQWSGAAEPRSGGWSASLAIPFADLRWSRGGPPWKINFVRAVSATHAHLTWAINPVMADADPPAWPAAADARFWHDVEPPRPVLAAKVPRPFADVYLLQTGGRDRDAFTTPVGGAFTTQARIAGADARYYLTPTVSLIGTVAPDFSNVETDQQSIAPQQLRRQYAEYRPFFTEGASFFDPSAQYALFLPKDQLFYSPALARIDRGLKLEGTSGTRSFGVLTTSGADPDTGVAFNDVVYGMTQKTSDNLLRVWVNGVNAVHSDTRDLSNEIGFAARNRPQTLFVSAQAGQETGPLVSDASQARTLRGSVDLRRPGVDLFASYVDIGPQFAPLDGFTSVADVRGPTAVLDFTANYPERSRLKSADLTFNYDRWVDSTGAVHVTDADVFLTVRTRNSVALSAFYNNGAQRFYDGQPYSGYWSKYANAQTLPYVYPYFELRLGDGQPTNFDVNYFHGSYGPSYLSQLSTSGNVQMSRRLAVSLDYGGTREVPIDGSPVLGQWLRRLSANYSFDKNATLSLALRNVAGRGSYATPGTNIAAAFHRRVSDANDLFIEYGSPAQATTLRRVVVKYVFRVMAR